MKRRLYRWLQRATMALLLLAMVVGIGRVAQLYYDSQYSGARAPYLQLLGPDRVTLRWQTEVAQPGVVWLGAGEEGLSPVATSPYQTTHQLSLTGLMPDTRYRYRVEGVTPAGEAASFITAPAPGSERPLRFWVVGDPGYLSGLVHRVKASAYQWMAANPYQGERAFDLLLTNGDNAYTSGRNSEFQRSVFENFGDELAGYGYWPGYGNHDDRRWAFFNIFNFPRQGEFGGVASGSDHYYAFDYGRAHIIFLDSQASDLDRDGAMAQWLERDLAASRQPWKLVILHHPPYSKGSHDSDSAIDSRGRMVRVRENLLPIIEAGGVDLVVAGHSHSYERSALLSGHFGDSASFDAAMVLDRDSPYCQPLDAEGRARGTLYVVAGSSSTLSGGHLDHPANPVGLHQPGSLLLDIDGGRLEGHFVNDQGEVSDHFAIHKGGTLCPPPSER